MRWHLLKHRDLLISHSDVQGMPRIQPAVGKVYNWCYHHIPNPLFRVDVPILQLLEHPLLRACRHSLLWEFCWPRGRQQQMTGWSRTTETSAHAPSGNTSDQLQSFLSDVQRLQAQSAGLTFSRLSFFLWTCMSQEFPLICFLQATLHFRVCFQGNRCRIPHKTVSE